MTDRPLQPEESGDPPCWQHVLEERPMPMTDETLSRLVRQLADAVVVCDPAGTIVFWNTAATRIFGWAEDEAVGQSLDIIVPERLRARHWDGYHRVMATGETKYGDRLLEVPALHRGGHTISIAFTVTLLHNGIDDSAVTAIAAVIRDDTERWRQHHELQQKVAELEEH
jgi:PAS domain S-box-containing protein